MTNSKYMYTRTLGALITDDAKCTRDIPAKPGNHLEIRNL